MATRTVDRRPAAASRAAAGGEDQAPSVRAASTAPVGTLAAFSLGANTGNRALNLERALGLLGEVVELVAVSPWYETVPVGFSDQRDFLNLVALGRTALPPAKLLKAVLAIERGLGRRRDAGAPRNGPRSIDIDLLFYGDAALDAPGLTVPHPRLAERAFVLVPLADVAPDLVHPVLGRSVRDLLGGLSAAARADVRPWLREARVGLR